MKKTKYVTDQNNPEVLKYKFAMKKGLLIQALQKEMLSIPYLCSFCVSRQTDDGDCTCSCHDIQEHLDAYGEQLRDRCIQIVEETLK